MTICVCETRYPCWRDYVGKCLHVKHNVLTYTFDTLGKDDIVICTDAQHNNDPSNGEYYVTLHVLTPDGFQEVSLWCDETKYKIYNITDIHILE